MKALTRKQLQRKCKKYQRLYPYLNIKLNAPNAILREKYAQALARELVAGLNAIELSTIRVLLNRSTSDATDEFNSI